MSEHFKLFKTTEVEHMVNKVISLGREINELQEELTRLKELNRELVEVLQELVNIVDDSMTGEYKIDSFTTQPARELLSGEKWEVQGE